MFSYIDRMVANFPQRPAGIVWKILTKLKAWWNIRSEYSIGKFSVLLPPNHLLPRYQRQHKKYDRFLPHLASFLQKRDVIVDVGANCADTLAGMISKNPYSQYICIEPDDVFFEFLSSNIDRIKDVSKEISVRPIKSLVGNHKIAVALEGEGGTKHVTFGAGVGKISAKKLDDILSDLNCSEIRLLKTDVDGFDHDVIRSAEATLLACRPLLFFECQYADNAQYEAYKNLINWLPSIGYADWVIFDNFGEIVLRTSDINNILQLMEYVWLQTINQTTRTIYYYDFLVCGREDSKFVDQVLVEYRRH